jgi:hypothetical protein
LPRLRRHAKDGAGFIRAFHGWFDGLGTLQYARSRGALPIVEGVAGLACDQGLHFDATAGALSLLEWLRQATDSQG